MYQNDDDWKNIACYLYGAEWREKLGIGQNDEEMLDDVVYDNNASSDNGQGQGYETGVLPLCQYLQNYVCDDNAADSQRALQFLKSYIGITRLETARTTDGNDDEVHADGVTAASLSDAKQIICGETKTTIKVVIDILKGRIPESKRTKKTTSELEKWLQKPNLIREYLFYTKAALEEMMNQRSMKLKASCSASIDKIIDALAGISIQDVVTRTEEDDENEKYMNPVDEAIKSMLEKSFLPHQKGTEREYTSTGHRLELPILRAFYDLIQEGQDGSKILFFNNFRGIKIMGAYKAGLAAKKDAIYAKDSIDFILTVVESGKNSTVAWGFEAKGRVTNNSVGEEHDFMDEVGRECHIRVSYRDVHKMIRKVDERFQLMQHAFVYDVQTVAHVIGDRQSNIIQSTIVDYSDDIKVSYGNVLDELKKITLDWAYTDDEQDIVIPTRVIEIASTVPTINGEDALYGTLHLWKAICDLPNPIPSFHRLIPAICAFWNAVKSGSDTTTKLMDDRSLFVPYVNCESVACSRLLMLTFVCCHRLNQIITASPDLNYPSLRHYRNAASQRTTFHSSLLSFEKIFRHKLELKMSRMQDSSSMNQDTTTPVDCHVIQRRNMPNRQKVFGLVPEKINFASTLSTKTPKKVTKQIMKGTASAEVEMMVSTCYGIPMKSTEKSASRCDNPSCDKVTRWYCAGCKRYLCMERQVNKDKPPDKSLELYCHVVRGKKITFMKTCYQKLHQNVWENKLKQEQQTSSTYDRHSS